MTDASITVRTAEREELPRVEALLETIGLPTRDVREKEDCFFVAREGAELIGVGGIERYGSSGLLRSVAVRESRRGQGYGTALCDALAERARADGVERLYLLTTTASDFFRRRGYEEIDRESVPPRIRRTSEFTDLCPASATCMRKALR